MEKFNFNNNQKKFLALVLGMSFIVSAGAGWLSGAAGFSYFIDNHLGKNYLTQNSGVSAVGSMQNDAGSVQSQGSGIENISSQPDSTVDAVSKSSPAVVSIIITKEVPVYEQYYEDSSGQDPFFNDFFGNNFFNFGVPRYRQKGTEKKEVGGGTGFIVSGDGLILTNKHVVEDLDAEYTVLTNDGKKFLAEVLAKDPLQDLAVIRINEKNLPILVLGDSDKLQIGQSVIAIGNALGEFRNTVSVGIISGLQREITAVGSIGQTEQLQELIQTDAAINQGNSGGPLLNTKGEVIGINVAIVQGAQNIGFSIPINKAKNDLEQIKKTGKISITFLGVRYVPINDEVKSQKNLPYNYGALIASGDNGEPAITQGSPAQKAGLAEGDIILAVNDKKIDIANPLAKIIQSYSPGDEVTLRTYKNGNEVNIKVKLSER